MTKTAYDVVTRALENINYAAAGVPPAAKDYQVALDSYKNFHDWEVREFTKTLNWTYDKVDERFWTYVADWFAGGLSLVLPTSSEDSQRAQVGAQLSERRLREMLARKRVQVTEAEYF